MSDGYSYPFYPQPSSYLESHQPEGQQKLICYECDQEIHQGEECFNLLYGIAGKGTKSGRDMVVETADLPSGDINLHYECLPYFLFNNIQDIATEIVSIDPELREQEVFCQGCGDRIELGDE